MNKKIVFIVVGVFVLVALVILVCYHSDYFHLKPIKLGTVKIAEKQLAISLFCKPRFRAPHDGAKYRILEVAQLDEPPQYYDLPDAFPQDKCHFDVYWYPTNSLVRFLDSGFGSVPDDPKFRSETILDFEKRTLFIVVRHQNRVYTAKLSSPERTLTFPADGKRPPIPSSYGISTSTANVGPEPVVKITIANEVADPVDDSWTKDLGIFVGTIAPK